MITYFKNLLNYLTNLNLIISSDNIYSLSCISIIKNYNIDNLYFHYILFDNSNLYLHRYLYILYGFFFKLNITYIDFIPNDINNFIYYSKLFNSNIKINIIDNFNHFSNTKYKIYINNYIENNIDKLLPDQKFFYSRLKKAYSDYLNYEMESDDVFLLKGLKIYFNEKKFNDSILWEISHSGDIAIDFFIKEGKNL
jgi:hypothetical protein